MVRRWLRLAWTLLWLAVVVAGAAWVADHPGRVSIAAGPWLIDTSFAGLVIAMAGFAAVAAVLFHGWRRLRAVPGHWRDRRRLHRLEDGTAALLDGLTHAAAGDVAATRQAARQVGRLLERPALAALLAAEAAEAAGDTEAAAHQFEALRGDGATRLLGLAGLARLAARAGDDQASLQAMTEADDAAPGTAWVLRARFEAEARLGQWPEARATLARAMAAGTWNDAEGRRRLACVLHELGHREEALGSELDRRLELAREAHRLAPELAVASLRLARLEAEAGHRRRARGLLAAAWRGADGAAVARQIFPALLAMEAAPVGSDGEEGDAARRLGAWQALARLMRPETVADAAAGEAKAQTVLAAHYALAEAALAAGLTGVARRHGETALAMQQAATGATGGPDRLQALLQAAVAEAAARAAETGEAAEAARARAAQWRAQAAVAPPEAAWLCRHCGRGHDHWQAVCGGCAAFDSLTWRRPVSARAGRLDAAVAPLALGGGSASVASRRLAATGTAITAAAAGDASEDSAGGDGAGEDVEGVARRGER
ncbi:MAG: heme biosynthesis HemY N-terminal domain-containing protein [Alphaproteobacteria bacterium]